MIMNLSHVVLFLSQFDILTSESDHTFKASSNEEILSEWEVCLNLLY